MSISGNLIQIAGVCCLVSLLSEASLTVAVNETASPPFGIPTAALNDSQVQMLERTRQPPTIELITSPPTEKPTKPEIKRILLVPFTREHSSRAINTSVKASSSVTEKPKNLVNVESTKNGSKVDVHVPLIFDMTNDYQEGRNKLDLSVLSGFVKVSKDRAKQPNGQLTGPVTVTIFGIPVFTGFRSPGEERRSMSDKLYDFIAKQERALGSLKYQDEDRAENRTSPVHSVLKNYQKTNEVMMRSLADVLSRAAVMANDKTLPIENVNGESTASRERDLVVPSKFSTLDLKPRQAEEQERLEQKVKQIQTNKI